MSRPVLNTVGSFESGAAAVSYVDVSGAYMDYDGAAYAQFGAKSAGSLGVKIRTVLTGAVKDALTFAAAGAATFAFAVTLASTLTYTAAASQVIPGATSYSIRNAANSADNWIILDAGSATLRGGLAVGGAGLSDTLTLHAGTAPSLGFRSTTANQDMVWSLAAGQLLLSSAVGIILTMGQSGSAAFAGPVTGITSLAIGGALSGVTSLAMAGALSGVTTVAASSTAHFGNPSSTFDLYGGSVDVRFPFATRAANVATQLFVGDSANTQTIDQGGAVDLGGWNSVFGHAYSWFRIEGNAQNASGSQGGYGRFMVLGSGGAMLEAFRLAQDKAATFAGTLHTIGSATFDNSVSLSAQDLGPGSSGQVLVVGRNTNGTNTGAGSVNHVSKSGTDGYVWQDNTGVLRINTASPTHANDTAGTIIGTQTSSRASKHIAGRFERYDDALAAIVSAPLFDFTYKSGAYGGQSFTGIVTDDSPIFGMDRDATHPGGKSLNTITAFGYTFGAIKALERRVRELEAQLAAA